MTINLNGVARRVTIKEGGVVVLPIGQVKEVIKLFIEDLVHEGYPASEILKLFKM